MQTTVYNTSLSATVLMDNTGAPNVYETMFYYHVRTINPTALSTVTVQFYWTDDRGVLLSETKVLPLNLLGGQTSGSIVVNLGINEKFYVQAALIGGGSYDIKWAVAGI